jgi:hypothetical protein
MLKVFGKPFGYDSPHSLLYNEACELRKRGEYERGYKLLKYGFETLQDPFCCVELRSIYIHGGWGQKRDSVWYRLIMENYSNTELPPSSEPPSSCDKNSHCDDMWFVWWYRRSFRQIITSKREGFCDVPFAKYIFNRLVVIALKGNACASYDAVRIAIRFKLDHTMLHKAVRNGVQQCNLEAVHALDLISDKVEDKILCNLHLGKFVQSIPLLNNTPAVKFVHGRWFYHGTAFLTYKPAICAESLSFFVRIITRAKQAVVNWILCAKVMRISKDVYTMIAKTVWESRNEPESWVVVEEETSVKRIKVE